jgi:VWFA-related protein
MRPIPLLLCALLGAVSAGEGGAQTTTIRADVNLVQLSVRVTDKEGRSVAGLTKDAFELFVDDVRIPITHFQSEDAPVTAGIVVDNSASMAPKRAEVIAAATAFAKASNPLDQMFVVHFNSGVWFGLPDNVPFTSSVPELQKAISRFQLGGTTALYDAMVTATKHFRDAAYGRKVLLVITDGGDNSSQATFGDVLNAVLSEGATIFAIGIFDPADRDANPKLLTSLAHAAGGQAFFPTALSDVTRICEEIAAEIRQAYTLGFAGEDDGKYHRIRVNATNPQAGQLLVQTRAGYFAR